MSRISGPRQSAPLPPDPQQGKDIHSTATVRVGEKSLSQVAKRLGIAQSALAKANPGIDTASQLKAGQELNLPLQSAPAAAPAETSDQSARAKLADTSTTARLQRDQLHNRLAARETPGAAKAEKAAVPPEKLASLRENLKSSLAEGMNLRKLLADDVAGLKRFGGPDRELATRTETELDAMGHTFDAMEHSLRENQLQTGISADHFRRLKEHASVLENHILPAMTANMRGTSIRTEADGRLPATGGLGGVGFQGAGYNDQEAMEEYFESHNRGIILAKLQSDLKKMYPLLETMMKNFLDMQMHPIDRLR
jgi:hypothetical protein